MDLQLGLMGTHTTGETAQTAYTGARYCRTDSGVYLKDFGRGDSDDSALLYSGAALDYDSIDDKVVIGDISAVCNTLTMTINPASTTEALIQLAAGKSLAIVSGTIVPVGLINITIYVDGVAGSTVTADYHRIMVTFDDVLCADIQIGYDGSNYFDGIIGNVQLWNIAFDANDVEYDYLQCYQNLTADNRPGTSLTFDNCKGYWPLIESSGDVCYDWSGNGNHGELIGFATDDSQWSNASALASPLAIQTALCEWGMGSNELIPDINNVFWTQSRGVIGGSTIDIDGHTISNIGFISSTDNDDHHIGRAVQDDSALILADTTYSYSLLLKAGARHWFYLRYVAYDSSWSSLGESNVYVDIENKTSGTITNSGILTLSDITFVDKDNDWVLVTCKLTVGSGSIAYSNMYCDPADADGDPYFQGDGSTVDFYCQHIQQEKGVTNTALVAQSTNALVPIRSWETAGQFKRDYSELNWNGRSYADCGNGADVNPSTAVIIELVLNIHNTPATISYFLGKQSLDNYRVYMSNGATQLSFATKTSDGYVNYTNIANVVGVGLIHVLCIFYANNYIKTYKNGVLADTNSLISKTGTLVSGTEDLLLGAYNATDLRAKGQFPLLKMYTDAKAQAIITGDLTGWIAKRYAKAKAKYNL